SSCRLLAVISSVISSAAYPLLATASSLIADTILCATHYYNYDRLSRAVDAPARRRARRTECARGPRASLRLPATSDRDANGDHEREKHGSPGEPEPDRHTAIVAGGNRRGRLARLRRLVRARGVESQCQGHGVELLARRVGAERGGTV